MLPAITASSNGTAAALASREPARAEAMAARHGVARVHPTYEALLEDREVDAVYLPLVNSLHLEWTERALAAGKHVLCEKPLAMSAAEAERMAEAARSADRLLMEAFMYRFHPRLSAIMADARSQPIRHVSAWFGFRVKDRDNYRLKPELGGGALMDVGCYGLSACRWLLGEPEAVSAIAHRGPTGVDLTVGAALRFAGGRTGFVWGSFESPEHQALEIVFESRTARLEQPFTAWRDPDDPYRNMVEAFAAAALKGGPAPIPLEESIANLRAIDQVRAAAGLSSP